MDYLNDIACASCGAKEFNEDDGYFYCRQCCVRAEDIMETDYQPEDLIDKSNPNFHHSVYRLRNVPIKTETLLSQSEIPCIPKDFRASIDVSQISAEVLSSEIRIRYVMGVQLMIQSQCEVLVEKFGASPLICGLVGVIWMRFVAASRVFDEGWADKTFEDSEIQYNGFSEERTIQSQPSKGTQNMYGQSGAIIWFRCLRKRIPISSSLAVSFLGCHIAREPILPTDIHTWALEGKLPYLTAFMDIEKHFGRPSSACPLSSSIMFKPFKVIGSRELESQSGFIAQSIGLQLPPVNFSAIARRYLNQLSLPHETILPHVTRIYEWSMPPDLWVSANPKRLPTRVCAMSIIMLAIRILYNINGFGKWEASLSSEAATESKSKKRKSVPQSGMLLHIQNSDFDATELLCNLEAMYAKTPDAHEYSKHLQTYLQYCKDVVFAGLKPLIGGIEEERTIEKLWSFYERQEEGEEVIKCKRKESRDEEDVVNCDAGKRSVRRMKLNMEENGLCYIPPRVKHKRYDHLHYIRKNDGGTRTYVAHADYYILLRACAQVAQVGCRYMHAAALKLEKRLSWIENRIHHSLHFRSQNPSPHQPTVNVDIDPDPPEDVDMDEPSDLSNFNLF